MKNILKIFSSDNLKKNLKNILDRFPITLIIIILISTLLFIELHYHNNISDFYNKKIIIVISTLIMTFIFSIGTYLSSENSLKNKLQRNLFQIIPLGFGIIFYNIFSLDLENFENFLFFSLTFTGIISFLFFAPYLKNLFKKGIKQSIFYTYFYNISVVILISFIFAGILFGLGAIGINAIEILFNFDMIGEKTYGNWAIISVSIITPIFALTKIPNKKFFLENHFNENAFFSFLIKFVAIPFIYLYFFILYAYTIKVLLNFSEWPRGEVSWLVIGFSIFGYLVYSFSYIFEEKNKLIKNFRKIFPYAVIPQVFMLFYAIYLRINQYDITVNRYFVIIFGLWLLVTSIYFIFSRKKNLIIIPTGLTFFVIIISIIPGLNVYFLPEYRQILRLENNLIKANILEIPIKKGIITPLKNYSDIDQNLSKNIYSGIDYLCEFDSCKSIKKLFPDIYAKILKKDKVEWEKNNNQQIERLENDKYLIKENREKRIKKIKNKIYEEPNYWELVHKITEKIKVKNYFSKQEKNIKFFEYSKEYQQDFFPINTIGYSKMYRISNYNKREKRKNYAEYNMVNQIITIKEDNKNIIKFSTKQISEKLIKEFSKNNSRNLNKNDLIFELEGGKYRLYFENISILNPDYKKEELNNNNENTVKIFDLGGYTNGFLLIK